MKVCAKYIHDAIILFKISKEINLEVVNYLNRIKKIFYIFTPNVIFNL